MALTKQIRPLCNSPASFITRTENGQSRRCKWPFVSMTRILSILQYLNISLMYFFLSSLLISYNSDGRRATLPMTHIWKNFIGKSENFIEWLINGFLSISSLQVSCQDRSFLNCLNSHI
jgi:hypothetical protein